MAIYMKIDGIKGDVTTQGYENTIELTNTRFSARCEASTTSGQVQNRQIRSPKLSEVQITKRSDSSGGEIFRHMLTRTVIPTVEIFFCSLEEEQLPPHLTYRLTDVIISSYQEVAVKESALALVDISLNYIRFEQTFNKFDSKNNFTPYRIEYDREKSAIV